MKVDVLFFESKNKIQSDVYNCYVLYKNAEEIRVCIRRYLYIRNRKDGQQWFPVGRGGEKEDTGQMGWAQG